VRRLLFSDEFYEPVAGSSVYEADFERQVWAQRAGLFPGWHIVEFKGTVTARDVDGAKKPDLALIHSEYRNWWVVEVELASHDLHNHVLPQVEVFVLGSYTAQHASQIADGLSGADAARVRSLVTSVQPRVLVISNDDVEGWRTALEERGAEYCVVQPHRDRRGRYAFAVAGYLPTAESTFLSSGSRAEWAPRAVRVQNPGALALRHGDAVSVRTREGVGEWKFISAGDGAYLMPTGPGEAFPASAKSFEIHQDGNWQLAIQVAGRGSSSRRGS
jgi:hypothetical protein